MSLFKPLFLISLLTSMMACTTHQTVSQQPPMNSIQNSTSKEKNVNVLCFNPEHYQSQEISIDGKTFKVRAYENIIYVANPVQVEYQQMNIYIPEAYYQQRSIDGFTANTAPIFLQNNIGGYMPSKAGTAQIPQNLAQGTAPTAPMGRRNKVNTIAMALSKGYIVASPATRGRTQTTGKTIASIVDLKSAVRYLHFNDDVMLGDANKIISNGTSAGGALSALLGASGNSSDYEQAFKQLGSATASDAIFAVSAYCPITNLEHADAAYEWQFNGHHDYKKIKMSMLDYHVQRSEEAGTLTAEEIQLSNQLKPLFTSYINALNLKDQQGNVLILDQQGNGSFKQYLVDYVIQSA